MHQLWIHLIFGQYLWSGQIRYFSYFDWLDINMLCAANVSADHIPHKISLLTGLRRERFPTNNWHYGDDITSTNVMDSWRWLRWVTHAMEFWELRNGVRNAHPPRSAGRTRLHYPSLLDVAMLPRVLAHRIWHTTSNFTVKRIDPHPP